MWENHPQNVLANEIQSFSARHKCIAVITRVNGRVQNVSLLHHRATWLRSDDLAVADMENLQWQAWIESEATKLQELATAEGF